MTEEHKKSLERKLWSTANELRSKMNADEFRDYIPDFIFYKYRSERLNLYADDALKHDGLNFAALDETKEADILTAVEGASLKALRYFIGPSGLFSADATKSAKRGQLILEGLT